MAVTQAVDRIATLPDRTVKDAAFRGERLRRYPVSGAFSLEDVAQQASPRWPTGASHGSARTTCAPGEVVGNELLLAFHERIPFAQALGGGDIAKGDRISFRVPVRTIHAGRQPAPLGQWFGPRHQGQGSFISLRVRGTSMTLIVAISLDPLAPLSGLSPRISGRARGLSGEPG